jgi:Fic family protein
VSATTAIEGNTLSEEQVRLHLEGQLKLPPSQQYLQKEIDNIITACNQTLELINLDKITPLDRQRIQGLNSRVLEGLLLHDYVIPGKIRTYAVAVGPYQGAPAEDCEFLLEKLCAWLNGDEFSVRPGFEIVTAILKAVIAHLYMAWIHPFGDGNGRTARLIEFEILISSGVPAPAAHLLSNHYNQTRSEYYRQLEQASKSGGNILPFITYAVQGFFDGLKAQLERIWAQQWDITWRNYVHELFSKEHGKTAVRRRHLALDLSRQAQAVNLQELATITPRIAKAYSTKTPKTLSRDINEIVKKGIVEKTDKGYRAKIEIIFSFLAPRAR